MIFPEQLCPEGNIIPEGNISTNHPSGRSINDIFNETELSKHIWKLKSSGRPYNTAWSIVKKPVPYTSGRPSCNLCLVWYGMVWYGMVWYGMVWYGMVWYGMVWYGMVWYGKNLFKHASLDQRELLFMRGVTQ